jgi:hypothetical protein
MERPVDPSPCPSRGEGTLRCKPSRLAIAWLGESPLPLRERVG